MNYSTQTTKDIAKKKAELARMLSAVKKDKNFIIDICDYLKTTDEVEEMISFLKGGNAIYSTVILKAVEIDRGY